MNLTHWTTWSTLLLACLAVLSQAGCRAHKGAATAPAAETGSGEELSGASREVLEVDLDRDGRRERVVLEPGRKGDERTHTLEVWREGKRLWAGVPRGWRPWKLAAADVDGDGRQEIGVGIHKSTRYFPQPHNCLFVYRFVRDTVVPRWLGSSLSKPFTDFTFTDLDGDPADELVAVETTREGRQCVAVYSWSGFGFALDRQRGAWKTARLLGTEHGKVTLEADSRLVAITRGTL
jgi:hypothetical protein